MSSAATSQSDWAQLYDLAGQQAAAETTTAVTTTTSTSGANSVQPSSDRRTGTRPSRRRSRASRKAPTTLLNTDTSNFRAMVQQFTGFPSAAGHQPAGPPLDHYAQGRHVVARLGVQPPPSQMLFHQHHHYQQQQQHRQYQQQQEGSTWTNGGPFTSSAFVGGGHGTEMPGHSGGLAAEGMPSRQVPSSRPSSIAGTTGSSTDASVFFA